ncbi:hypothetical protein [Actinoplanes sp. GCM10030250]|uniref:hypothetical protein n=1 Tax=Actinoplanes sp. GCM10030250 TaxID=3273376 RepID=UPI0036169477
MRLRETLLRVIRARRADSIALDEADRLVTGDPAGPDDPALGHLLDAVRAPATAGELSGERATIAALAAERRRAAATREPSVPVVAAPRPARTIIVTAVAALAVLSAGGTAVAARTGNLPDGIQQNAHRLFSGLGVPAPSTSPAKPEPSPSPSTRPARPAPAPSRSAAGNTPTATTTPSVAVAPGDDMRARWCAAWLTADAGGHPMNGRERRELFAAAGGEENVAEYCGTVIASPSPSGSAGTPGPSKSVKSKKPKPPRPGKDPLPTPSVAER